MDYRHGFGPFLVKLSAALLQPSLHLVSLAATQPLWTLRLQNMFSPRVRKAPEKSVEG